MNVLVVDDDREIVDSISIFLSGEGYKALKAYDGIEALDILSENEVHLMILDIMMPKLDGLCVNTESKTVKVDGENVRLTPVEYKILELLVRNRGRVFSAEDIYSNVWNEQNIVGDNTIAVHVRHIREKIEINPKEPKYLKVVWGIGYKID